MPPLSLLREISTEDGSAEQSPGQAPMKVTAGHSSVPTCSSSSPSSPAHPVTALHCGRRLPPSRASRSRSRPSHPGLPHGPLGPRGSLSLPSEGSRPPPLAAMAPPARPRRHVPSARAPPAVSMETSPEQLPAAPRPPRRRRGGRWQRQPRPGPGAHLLPREPGVSRRCSGEQGLGHARKVPRWPGRPAASWRGSAIVWAAGLGQ